MTVTAMAVPGAPPDLERLPPWRLWALTSGNLAYGFMMADQGILLAPLEAEHLFGEQASLGLAAMAVCCGLAQLTGPAAGRWSDRHRSRWGRRRPCMLMAMAAIWFLTGCLSLCSDLKATNTFMFAFLLQQFAWNVMQTVQAGLVPDLVPSEQRGVAGGATAANTLAGALGALCGVRFLGGLGLRAHYVMTALFGLACCLSVCMAANEKPTHTIAEKRDADPTSLLRHIKDCYQLDVNKHPQFAKLLVSKTLYCASVMVKGFLLFFIQDTFDLGDVQKEQFIVGDTAVAAEATAALSAMAAMALLDAAAAEMRAGGAPKKREDEEHVPPDNVLATFGEECPEMSSQTFVGAVRARLAAMTGSCWMALLWFGPPLVGFGVLRDREAMIRMGAHVDVHSLSQTWAPYMVLGTAVWGIGQGVYLAGDQALSYALLPDLEEASRLLGLTSVCAAAGAVLGGSAAGGLLYAFGGSVQEQGLNTPHHAGAGPAAPGYAYPGYAAIFILASCLSGLCCAVLSTIRAPTESGGERARIVQ